MPVPARPPHRLLPAPRHIRPAVGAFLLLALVSALLYSGGHNLDPQALWFHPVHNFLCDLFMPLNTYNGRSNMASALPGISGGLLLVAGGLLPAWTSVALRLAPERAVSRLVATLGLLALGAVSLVPLENLVSLPWPHHFTLLGAVLPGWLATSGVALLALRHPGIDRSARLLGLAVLVAVPVIFACYLPYALAGDTTAPAVAFGQKVVLCTVLAWLWALGGSPALRD